MLTYLFILFAVIAIGGAVAMVMHRNPVYSALFLVLNMASLAGIYLLLKAQFLAVIQILVYAGAIMVLFLFVIMLLNVQREEGLFRAVRTRYIIGFILGAGIFSQILYTIGHWTDTLPTISSDMKQIGTVEAVGDVMFTDYLLPFEITGILLTAAVVGAILIAQQRMKPDLKSKSAEAHQDG